MTAINAENVTAGLWFRVQVQTRVRPLVAGARYVGHRQVLHQPLPPVRLANLLAYLGDLQGRLATERRHPNPNTHNAYNG